MPVEDGYSAPFVRLYYEDKELSAMVESFKYVYDEEDDDTCIITINSDRRQDPDEKWFQEKARLKVIWGFINGPTCEPIKVFIQDVKWMFGESVIKGTLTCTEKAVSMKYVDNNRVFKNKSLLDVAKQMADEHGLKAYVQIDGDEDTKPDFTKLEIKPNETVDAFIIRRQKFIDQKLRENVYKVTPDKEQSRQFEITLSKDAPKRDPTVDYTKLFKNHQNLPQSNKTDAQFLAEIARKQEEAYMVETRGEDLIIKKRNFNQTPYRSYTYGGTLGELQSFAPESKNRGRKGHAVNKGFGSWDPLTKTFYSGNANADNQVKSPMLNAMVEQLKFYKRFQNKFVDGGLLRGAGFSQSKLKHIFIGKNNFKAKGDNTLDYTLKDGKIPINVNQRVTALEFALKGVNDIIKNYNANVYNSVLNDPNSAMNSAGNSLSDARLRKNPATATLWGDPKLKVGKIITILGVANKYSGNYYITKCEHTIDNANGYMVDLDMVRHGSNIRVNDDYMTSEELGIPVNKKIGPSTNTHKKQLKIKTNG